MPSAEYCRPVISVSAFTDSSPPAAVEGSCGALCGDYEYEVASRHEIDTQSFLLGNGRVFDCIL